MHKSRRKFIKQNSIALLATSIFSEPFSYFLDRAEDGDENKEILFFDAFTRIGPRRYKHPAEKWELEDLIKELNHCSVSGAMVASTLSVSYDAMYSNLELSEKIKSYPNLFGIWNVLPHHTGEFPSPKELGTKMEEHNVRAVTINPLSNGWDWTTKPSNDLLEWLNENRILTMTSAAELGGWEKLNQFLSRYRNIPILIYGTNWIEQRYVLPLLKEYPNLHISFEQLQINQGLEDLYKNGSIDQLIFASDGPTMSVGAHRTYIDYADIPDSAKAKVAGGNLIRLLKGLRPRITFTNNNEDILMRSIRNGKPLPVPVIDMHMHMIHPGLNGAGGAGYRIKNGEPDRVFEMMRRLGCIGGGFMSWNGVVSNDSVQGNKLVKELLDTSSRGFWGLATFSPTHYTQDELSVMIPEVYADKRIIGMKPYHFYGLEYHHPSYDIWWEYGNKNNLYALIHPSRSDLLEVEKLAEKYSNVRWVIAHSGGSYKMADMVIEVMKKFKNVYAEITLTPVPMGIIEYLVSHLGDDRILYGSDLPMRDPRQQLGWVVFSQLPLTTKKKILGKNAFNVIEPCIENMPIQNVPISFLS